MVSFFNSTYLTHSTNLPLGLTLTVGDDQKGFTLTNPANNTQTADETLCIALCFKGSGSTTTATLIGSAS